MSNGIAPSCPISHSQPTQERRRLPRPIVDVATVPPAHDLRSVINAINIMNNVVQNVTRGQPQINNVYPVGETSEALEPIPPQPPPQYASQGWRQTGRGYEQQTVTNPDDTTEKINISSLTYVSWQDMVTGHHLTYTRD